MKANRITAFAVVTLALLLLIGQGFSGGAKAAPGITAHIVSVQQAGGKPAPSQPSDQTPFHISVQGRLTNPAGNPITTMVNVTFNLYSTSVGGTAFFTEGPVSITPNANGLFTYQLGTNPTFTIGQMSYFDSKVYLGITVGSDTEMTPRTELTASPYAMSLAPGAAVVGAVPQAPQPYYGAFNAVNTDTTDSRNAGVYGSGPRGVYGYSSSGIGVVGQANSGYGGVFTGTNGLIGIGEASQYGDGLIGLGDTGCTLYCEGVYARETGDNSYAIYASVANTGHPNDYGARITNYDLGSTALGLQVIGTGLATGGFSTGGSYQMVVRYNGTSDLHSGDVLALDGNNDIIDGAQVFGTVKADGSNAAIGVAQYRYMVFNMPARPADKVHSAEPAHHNLQVDEQATTFKTGDYIEVVVLGQAQIKPSGPVAVGDHLAVASDGTVVATHDATASIGRVGSKPNQDGFVSVFVNFK